MKLPESGCGPFFDHVEKIERDHWEMDHLMTNVPIYHPVMINLDSDSENDSDNTDSGMDSDISQEF